MRPKLKFNWSGWLPARGSVILSLTIAGLATSYWLGALPVNAKNAQVGSESNSAVSVVKQVSAQDYVDVGPAHAQVDNLAVTFASSELPANANILVDWHAVVFDNNNVGCRAAAAVRLDGTPGTFTDMGGYQEVSIYQLGLPAGVENMSGSTVFATSRAAHTITLVLIAHDCGTRTFYVRSLRAFALPR